MDDRALSLRQDSRPGISTALGFMLGMLAGFILTELGLGRVLGDVLLQSVALVSGMFGALVAMLGRLRVMLWVDALLVVVFLVIADTPLMAAAANAWVRNDALPAHADAIVVLSGSINSSGTLKDVSVGRLLTGLELYQRGIAPRLFTTTISENFGGTVRTSTADQERLVTLGGARSGWTPIPEVHVTRDEALGAASLLSGTSKTVVVVTTPLHTRRACATFEAVGLKVTCVASREQEYAAWHPRSSRERLETFRQYIYERLGMVKYRMKGWLSHS